MNIKSLFYLGAMVLATTLAGCLKDPLAEINEGAWNKERNILDIRFAGQIGTPAIVRDASTATIEFKYDANLGADYSAVEVVSIEVSYKASASVGAGQTLNFNNPDRTATITVHPVTGDPIDWTVKLVPFTEPLEGQWAISQMRLLINVMGDFPQWGGTWDENNISDFLPQSSFEIDNKLTFTFEGFNAAGNSFGTFNHEAGPDGKFGEFTNTANGYNFNEKFRRLPKGAGKWEKNYTTNTLSFTDAIGTITTATLIDNGATLRIRFDYADEIFWDNPWDTFAKINQETKYFWYTVRKL